MVGSDAVMRRGRPSPPLSTLREQCLWVIIRLYVLLRRGADTFGVRLKGLGWLLRRTRDDHVFESQGYAWYFDHRIANTYAALLAGTFSEPETHIFLNAVAAKVPQEFLFVDVGANIGEMVIPLSLHPKVRRVVAYEPHPDCAAACRQIAALNDINTLEVHELVVGDGTQQKYVVDSSASALSGIRPNSAALAIRTVRLDDVLDVEPPCLMLVDVEGAELDVLRGAQSFVRRVEPLIIFEYHDITKTRFCLLQVSSVLGPKYRIVRLRKDGRLDCDLSHTYNCVAIPRDSTWSSICDLFVVE